MDHFLGSLFGAPLFIRTDDKKVAAMAEKHLTSLEADSRELKVLRGKEELDALLKP